MAKEDAEDFKDIFTHVGNLYDDERSSSGSPEVGQFVWVPVCEMEGRPWIADVTRDDPTSHTTAEFRIRKFDDSVDFKGKGDRFPVHALKLTANHELIVTRAKKRLCLITGRGEGVDGNTLPEGPQKNKGLNAFPTQYFLAPLYSASSSAKTAAFGSVMSARIRCLMYPEYFWMKRSGGIVSVHSVARLDHTFCNPLSYGCELENLFVSDEALAFIQDQIRILFNLPPSDDFLAVQEMLCDALPDVFKS